MTRRYGFAKVKDRRDAGVYESPDGQWRVVNPWQMDTPLNRRWLVQELMPDGDWFSLDDDYSTMRDAIDAIAEERQ